jgi:serine/threonine protein kinase
MAKQDSLPLGTHLGEYRLDAILGTGGFGITYKAEDTHLRMPVAIKEFYPSGLVHREADGAVMIGAAEHAHLYASGLERFIAEGQTMARFKHPAIIRVVRYFTANQTGYIVMEFEEGKSLSAVLKERRDGFEEAELRRLFIPVMAGLNEVHQKDILHRDIKPGNIYIRNNGSPVLLDFGAAGEIAVADPGGAVFTPGYAPEELLTGDTAHQGPWTDIYSLGATLYRLIVNEVPVDVRRRLIAQQAGDPDPLARLETRVKPGRFSTSFLDSIHKMLELHRRDRPHRMRDVFDLWKVPLGDPTSGGLSAESSRSISNSITQRRRTAENYKLVFAGPVGAGKTTAVGTLSDIPIVDTNERASDMTRKRKAKTTVALDYGVMEFGENERLHLYGAPGQERFSFMWDLLQKGAIGLVLIVDNSRPTPFKDLEFYLDSFQGFIAKTKVCVGVSHMDVAPHPLLSDYHAHMAALAPAFTLKPPIFEVDPRNRRDMLLLVQSLLYYIDPGVEDYSV